MHSHGLVTSRAHMQEIFVRIFVANIEHTHVALTSREIRHLSTLSETTIVVIGAKCANESVEVDETKDSISEKFSDIGIFLFVSNTVYSAVI